MKPVLGVNFGTHDAAAAIVCNGRVIAAAEEERFARIKHTKELPEQAIAFCLREAGLGSRDLDCVALFVDPIRQLALPFANLISTFPASLGSFRSDIAKVCGRLRAMDRLRQTGLFRRDCHIKPVAHHLAHAASSYLLSPFDEAVVVTIDGRGEYETACVFHGRGNQLIRRHSVLYPHSVGYLYSMITAFLGFRPQRDEYKVMGLAAYGTPNLTRAVSNLATFDNRTGRLRLNLRYFDHHLRPSRTRSLFGPALVGLLGPPRRPDGEITQRHCDIAHAVQALTQQLVLGYVSFGQQIVGSRNLCLAGGVALNAVANAAIIACGRFDAVFIQPAAGDAGTSIGAALAANPPEVREVLTHVFLGPEYGPASIEFALRTLPPDRVRVRRVAQPECEAAALIHQGAIVGWHHGRMEFGPRALGSRSILASPRDGTAIGRINALIKRRELFRPLAPAVLAEDAGKYFDVCANGRYVYPFMLATAATRLEKRSEIPAVVHVDGSARVQTVAQGQNPMFWRLIEAYRHMSGVPLVLNTSFNGPDEPIVCSPLDAVRTFIDCRLDALLIGEYAVESVLRTPFGNA